METLAKTPNASPAKKGAIGRGRAISTAAPKFLSATLHETAVRVAEGTRCPCGKQIRPHDVEIVDGETARVICACHRDLITVSRRD